MSYDEQEPYFEDETVAELGFSFENTLHGGAIQPFVTPSDSNDLPLLGFWAASFPGMRSSYSGQLPLGGSASLTKATYTPIVSKHYENVQSDDFWDFDVSQWGPPIMKPYIYTPAAHFEKDEHGVQSKPVIKVSRDEDWHYTWDEEFKKELNSQRVRHGGSETKFTLTLDSQERDAHSIEKQLILQTLNIEKQDKFRSDQTLRVKEIQLAMQKLNDATAASDIKQKAILLLRLLQFETRGQNIEIIEFAGTKRINNALYDEHKSFLPRLNSQLRKVTHNS